MGEKERKEVFRAIVGSHNYNLTVPSSDKDYKVFVLPSINDLYRGTRVSKQSEGDVDLNVSDIRNLPRLLFKTNINFTETLFSSNLILSDPRFQWIIEEREAFAAVNIPYLYQACMGMEKQKMVGIGRRGYDGKTASISLRLLDFLLRYHDTGFTGFETSFRYEEEDPMRELLLEVKMGKVPERDFMEIREEYYPRVERIAKDYLSYPTQEQHINRLDAFILRVVMEELKLHKGDESWKSNAN